MHGINTYRACQAGQFLLSTTLTYNEPLSLFTKLNFFRSRLNAKLSSSHSNCAAHLFYVFFFSFCRCKVHHPRENVSYKYFIIYPGNLYNLWWWENCRTIFTYINFNKMVISCTHKNERVLHLDSSQRQSTTIAFWSLLKMSNRYFN